MVRKAEEKDLERVSELFKQLHGYHVKINPETNRMPEDKNFFINFIKDKFREDSMRIFVSEDKGEIDGYIILRIIDINVMEKNPRRICFIDHIVADENKRRGGTGSKLMEFAERYGAENGCGSVQLSFDAVNEAARSFYEKLGFKPRKIIMCKKIGGNRNDGI